MRFGRFEENIDAVKVLFVIFAVACALELAACAYCVDISDRLFFYALVAYTLILPFIIGFALDAGTLENGDSCRDTAVFDETGIRFARVKAEDRFMPWDSVYTFRLVPNRSYRGSHIEIKDISGNDVFNFSFDMKIIKYIWREHPELPLTDEFGNPVNKQRLAEQYREG